MVGYPRDVRDITLGEKGTLAAAGAGKVLVDMTTSEPSLAREILRSSQVAWRLLDRCPRFRRRYRCPRSRLSIMIGGDAEAVEALMPLWHLMGKTIVHQGDAGSGQHAKMVNQILIASNMVGVCEACFTAIARVWSWKRSCVR